MKDVTIRNPVRPLPQHLQPAPIDPALGIPSATMEGEVPLREYFKVIIKYRAIIGASAVLGLILAIVVAFTATPLYTAESTVRISTYEPVLTSTKIEDMLQERSRESTYLETQIQELKSYSLADQVLSDEKIRKAVEGEGAPGYFASLFGSRSGTESARPADPAMEYKNPVLLLRRYLQGITIEPVRRTSLVNISATAQDPQVAALMANKHALQYIDWVRTARVEQQARGLTFLRAQADELREKVAGYERELADYAEANSIVALNKDQNITVEKMSQLNKLLTDATAKRIEAENLFKEAERSLSNPSAGFDDPSAQTMRSELAKLEGEFEQLSSKFTASYPKVQQLKSQIEGVKQAILGQRRQIVVGYKAKMLAAQQEEKNLLEELEQQKSQTFELAKRQVQYNVLNRELTSSRDLLQSVLKQIKETSLTVESNASNVSVVDYAVVPMYASFPRKQLLLLVGLVAGLGIGLALSFLLNYLDNTIRTPEDVGAILQIASLGVVPSFELEGGEGEDEAPSTQGSGETIDGERLPVEVKLDRNPVVFTSDPRSLASESYRTIRTGILLSQAGEPPRTILVTSAQSSEGKTTSSINIAASLGSAGGRVILVDADLRRPSVHSQFNMPTSEPGLVEVITGQAELQDVIIPEVTKRVSVLRSGKIPPNPAELLGSMEMAALIDKLSENYDYVVIDSPPVLPVTDSVILSRYVDGVVLVIRGASTPRKVVRDAKNRLQAVGARFLGAVLNDVDVTSGDYYYYNRYYHAYYKQDPKSETNLGSEPRRRRRQANA